MQSPVHRMLVPSVLAFLATTATTTSNTCPASITHDLSSTRAFTADIHPQSLRAIAPQGEVLAATRGVPYAPHPDYRVQTQLDWEESETRDFLNRQLSRDPRLQPSDIVVDDGHMNQCTACTHDEGLQTSLHGTDIIAIGNTTQLLVDDWPLYSWTNIVRELESPRSAPSIMPLDSHNDPRYGCPCTAHETPCNRGA